MVAAMALVLSPINNQRFRYGFQATLSARTITGLPVVTSRSGTMYWRTLTLTCWGHRANIHGFTGPVLVCQSQRRVPFFFRASIADAGHRYGLQTGICLIIGRGGQNAGRGGNANQRGRIGEIKPAVFIDSGHKALSARRSAILEQGPGGRRFRHHLKLMLVWAELEHPATISIIILAYFHESGIQRGSSVSIWQHLWHQSHLGDRCIEGFLRIRKPCGA